MHNHRVPRWPRFRFKDPLHRCTIQRIGSQPIDRLRRQRHQSSAAQNLRRALQRRSRLRRPQILHIHFEPLRLHFAPSNALQFLAQNLLVPSPLVQSPSTESLSFFHSRFPHPHHAIGFILCCTHARRNRDQISRRRPQRPDRTPPIRRFPPRN